MTGKNDEWRCRCGRLQSCTCEWIYACVCVCYSETDVKYRSLLKVVFIMSERAVSCADHYHLSAHATVTGKAFVEICMGFISFPRRCVRDLLCAVHAVWPEASGGEAVAARQCVFSHEEPLTAGCPPEEKKKKRLPVNRPLTQKAGPPKTPTMGSGALDALVPLSASHCAMTRTNCVYRPLHKNISGALAL